MRQALESEAVPVMPVVSLSGSTAPLTGAPGRFSGSTAPLIGAPSTSSTSVAESKVSTALLTDAPSTVSAAVPLAGAPRSEGEGMFSIRGDYLAIVHTPIPIPQALKMPEASKALDKRMEEA